MHLMPQLLCLWNLSRQTHRELRKFCVPELQAALADLQTSQPQIYPWTGSNGSGSDALAPQNKLSLGKPVEPLPISNGDNDAVSVETRCSATLPGTDSREGQGSCACLLHLAYFEDDAIAKKALQRCVLLTAIIEVNWTCRSSACIFLIHVGLQ